MLVFGVASCSKLYCFDSEKMLVNREHMSCLIRYDTESLVWAWLSRVGVAK